MMQRLIDFARRRLPVHQIDLVMVAYFAILALVMVAAAVWRGGR